MFMQAIMPIVEKAQSGNLEGAATDFFLAMGATEELLERTLPGSWSAMAEDAATWFQVEMPAAGRWQPDPAKIEAIKVPIALMTANEPPPFRESGELLQAWQPSLTLLAPPADDHFLPLTATAETAAVIDDWIKSQGAPD